MKRCPLCGSTERELLYPSTLTKTAPALNQYLCTSSSYGLHGPIYKCSKCEFVFIVDNAPIVSILNRYEQAEDPVYVAEEPGRRSTFARHLNLLKQLSPKKGKLLDVGAYTGLFLAMARDSGWDVSGIEPSKWAVAQAKKLYGLTIKNNILKHNLFNKNSFDIVTMWDVIEHFTDPKEAVEISHSYLKPGGILAITTIDVESLPAKILKKRWPWFMRMHRVYFSQKTLIELLEKKGFKVIKITPHIRIVSLKYLFSRFKLPSPRLRRILGLFSRVTGIGKLLVPFYIGDLFDIYAQKQN